MPQTSQAVLMDVFNRMLERYGPQHWWPGDGWFETMVGAILTQATSWSNVEKALANLKRQNLLFPKAIRGIEHEKLAQLIYPSGYYNAKAKKLKSLAHFLHQRFGDDLERMKSEDIYDLRQELLSVHGIGEETADAILLYALEKPAFVVDAYTRRIFSRLGLIAVSASYSEIKQVFEGNLPPSVEVFSEYHALIVQHGKNVCRKQPVCSGCCLLSICPTGKTMQSQNVS